MDFSVRAALEARCVHVPWTFEQPARSYMFSCANVRRLCRRSGVSVATTEYCMWGMRWRKSTSFVSCGLDLTKVAAHRCQGAKRGLCARTQLPHLVLKGVDADGIFFTKKAEPYPTALCNEIARSFQDSRCQSIAREFERFVSLKSGGAMDL